MKSGLALAIALAASVLIATVAGAAQDPLVFEYRGWHVDLARARGAAPDRKLIDAVERQLDIVENVGLKPQVAFMRTIRIWTDPENEGPGPGHYGHATGIDLRVRALQRTKPIILLELLHAYHDRRVPDGFRNADLRGFFGQAKRAGWPADAYMLKNDREFVATTASVYLFGDIGRPPHSRRELRSRQPRYYEWLAGVFDEGKPRQ